ncbi:unnamed protein product [[Candida] boidinii]|nr:unnamed protein product [[Candida] boidinii]
MAVQDIEATFCRAISASQIGLPADSKDIQIPAGKQRGRARLAVSAFLSELGSSPRPSQLQPADPDPDPDPDPGPSSTTRYTAATAESPIPRALMQEALLPSV